MPTGLTIAGSTLLSLISGLAVKIASCFQPIMIPEVSILKAFLRSRGVDLRKIPDACLTEIVQTKTEEARLRALAEDPSGTRHDFGRRLRVMLIHEAELLQNIISNGPEKYTGMPSTRALLKYGVVEPRYPPIMTPDEFVEACERGTLLAELEQRISLRDN